MFAHLKRNWSWNTASDRAKRGPPDPLALEGNDDATGGSKKGKGKSKASTPRLNQAEMMQKASEAAMEKRPNPRKRKRNTRASTNSSSTASSTVDEGQAAKKEPGRR